MAGTTGLEPATSDVTGWQSDIPRVADSEVARWAQRHPRFGTGTGTNRAENPWKSADRGARDTVKAALRDY